MENINEIILDGNLLPKLDFNLLIFTKMDFRGFLDTFFINDKTFF